MARGEKLSGTVECYGCMSFWRREVRWEKPDEKSYTTLIPFKAAAPMPTKAPAEKESGWFSSFVRTPDTKSTVDTMTVTKSTSEIPRISTTERVADIRCKQEAALALLGEFAKHISDGNYDAAAGYFTKRGKFVSLMNDTFTGPEEIKGFFADVNAEERYQDPGEWKANPHCGFERQLSLVLESGARHEAVQTAFVEGDNIREMVVKPKHTALSCVFAFTKARAALETEAALETMTQHVVWKTWHGFEFKGKENVRSLLNDQTRRNEERKALSDFELVKTGPRGSEWKRLLQIEREGIPVRAEQTIFIVGQIRKQPSVTLAEGRTREVVSTVPRINHVELHTLHQEGEAWVRDQR